ncbi:MAG: hypothetical protein Tsb0013_24780 [Phycisphaerales bacterium]
MTRIHTRLIWFVSAMLLLSCTRLPVHAQVIKIPEDDSELLERFFAFEDAFRRTSRSALDGDLHAAISATLELYPEAREIHPGAEALIAGRLQSYYGELGDEKAQLLWAERGLEISLSAPSQRDGIVPAAQLLSGLHARAGRIDDAADALRRGDHPRITDRERAGLYRTLGYLLARSDREEHAYDAFSESIASLERADAPAEDVYALYYARLLNGLGSSEGDQRRFNEYEAVFTDPRFADVPRRAADVGWQVVRFANQLGETALAVQYGYQVLDELARFEDALGEERALELHFDEGYVDAAIALANALSARGQRLEALEVLESARVAYPQARRIDAIEREIRRYQGHVGINATDARGDSSIADAIQSEGVRPRPQANTTRAARANADQPTGTASERPASTASGGTGDTAAAPPTLAVIAVGGATIVSLIAIVGIWRRRS